MNISINDIIAALTEAGRGLQEQENWNRWAVDMACVLKIDLLSIQRLPGHDVFPVLRSQIKDQAQKLVETAEQHKKAPDVVTKRRNNTRRLAALSRRRRRVKK